MLVLLSLRNTNKIQMNICMVVYAYYPHDESRVQREAIALREKGYGVDVICLRKGNEPIRGQLNDGINFYRLLVKKREKPNLVSYLVEYSAFFFLVRLKLIMLLLEKRYRVIQFHNPPDALVFAGFIPKILGTKIILDIHDLMPEAYATKFNLEMDHWFIQLIIFVERISCSFANHILVVTEIWRKWLLGRGIPEKKCSVVMNLPDERIFRPVKPLSVEKKYFNLIYHGTVANRYGVDIAIRAINILKNTLPEIRLNIIGGGEDLEECIKLSYPVKDKVYFSKDFVPVNTIPEIIAKMDVGIVPNRLNSFTKGVLNAKLLEYVAMGVPAIVARTPGIEYYFDESMVAFFEPGNADELAQKILWLYNNPDERTKLVKKAKKFLEHHNWLSEKKKYYSIISSLIVFS